MCGASISGGGDVNADGYSDIVVGCPLGSMLNSNEGVTYILLGNDQYSSILQLYIFDVKWGFFLSGRSGGDQVRCSTLKITSFLLLYPCHHYFFLINPRNEYFLPFFAFPIHHKKLGRSVAIVKDINGDGFDDVVMGFMVCD